MAPGLFRRQCSIEDFDNDSPNCNNTGYSWWWSTTGMAVRYIIVAVIFVTVIAALLFAYTHAQRRVRAGKEPLAYHRWLVARRQRRYTSEQSRYAHYAQNPQQAYGMNNYAPPPPAYNAYDVPPTYQPPDGGSKTMANQNVEEMRRGDGESSTTFMAPPPSHPPPGHVAQ